MIMVAFITLNSSLAPLIEGLCSSNPWEFEISGFRWNRTDDQEKKSPSWPTEPACEVSTKKLKLGLKLERELKEIPHKYGHICVGFFSTLSQLAPDTRPLRLLKTIYDTKRSWDKQKVRP